MKHISTDNLETSTAQEVFDFIAHHLLTQRQKSERSRVGTTINGQKDTVCVYRNDAGLSCAAGILLTDEEAREADALDDSYWSSVVEEGIAPVSHCHLIRLMQNIHDNRNPISWLSELRNLGEERCLNTDILNQFQPANSVAGH